jgi:hypothetical protein
MAKTVLSSRIFFTDDQAFVQDDVTQLVFLNYGTNPVNIKFQSTVYRIPETPVGGVNPSRFVIDNFGHSFDVNLDFFFDVDPTGTKTNQLVVNYFNLKKK